MNDCSEMYYGQRLVVIKIRYDEHLIQVKTVAVEN